MNERSRPVTSRTAKATALSASDSTRTPDTAAEMLAEFVAGERDYLPGALGDIWRHGYTTAVDKLAPQITALNAEADRLWFEARNPQSVVEQTRQTLRLMETAQGREADARRRAALDRVQAADPLEYRRISYLGLTDRAAYLAALEAWEVTR